MNINKRICVITGCNTGIGKATAIGMAKLNYNVIMLVRDSEKSRAAHKEIEIKSGNKDVYPFYVDLSSQQSITEVSSTLIKELNSIDVLINNAAVVKRTLQRCVDNIEMTLAVNYLAPFLLCNQLLPLLEKSKKGRIVNLTSELYKRGTFDFEMDYTIKKFNGDKAYANSKFMVVILTKYLSGQLKSKEIMVNCVHPGVASTEAFREYPNWLTAILNLFLSKPNKAAESVIYLSTHKSLADTTGEYFYKKSPKKILESVLDKELQLKVWEYANELTKKETEGS